MLVACRPAMTPAAVGVDGVDAVSTWTPRLDASRAAIAIQRQLRFHFDMRNRHTRNRVAEMLAAKRRERQSSGGAASAQPPVSPPPAPSAALASLSAPLEERRRELARLVEAERARVASLQAACEAAGVDSPLPAPPMSPPSCKASAPLLSAASPLPADLAPKTTPKRGQHGGYRTSLDEFRKLEAECELAGMHSPHPAPPRPTSPPPVAPISSSSSLPRGRAADEDTASNDAEEGAAAAAFAPVTVAASSSSRPSSSTASSLRASDEKLSSVLAYIEEAESRTAEQKRLAAAAPPMPLAVGAAAPRVPSDPHASRRNVPPPDPRPTPTDPSAFPPTSRRLGFTDPPDESKDEASSEAVSSSSHQHRRSWQADTASDEFKLARGGHNRRQRWHSSMPDGSPEYISSSDVGPRAPARSVERPLASASSLLPSTASPAPPCGGALSTFSACGDAAGQSGNGGGEEDATVGGTSEYVTPPAGSKQQQRASELANTVYAGVKHKMSLMKEEVRMREPTSAAAAAKTARPLPMHLRRPQLVTLTASFLLFLLAPLSSTIPRLACSLQLVTLRQGSVELQRKLAQKEIEQQQAAERSQIELEERLAAQADASEVTLKRHVEFIDRLLADKAELAKQCEGLSAQMRSLEERYAAGEAKREEAYAKELQKQKQLWAQSEKAKREQWLADKTKEIKESTVRGLEPDIQRLVQRHRDEAKKIEEALREEHRRELESERSRHQREMSRMQEGGIAERHAAQERERELCAKRLQEMSMHFEEQLRQQRERSAASAAQEQEERDKGRRREIERLEDELRAAKAREDAAISSGREERRALQEKLGHEMAEKLDAERSAHASARAEWEAAFEAEVNARLDRERSNLEAAAAAARQAQIGVVVDRLGAEMAQTEQQWQAKLDAANRNADARVADAQRKADVTLEDVRTRYVTSVERTSELEARAKHLADELLCAQELCGAREVEAERLRREADARAKEAAAAGELAAAEVKARLHEVMGERAAMGDELAQLRAEQRALLSAHETALSAVQAAKDSELAEVGERVRGLERQKDETIQALQAQVGALQGELHTTREQLHATQQEILSFT